MTTYPEAPADLNWSNADESLYGILAARAADDADALTNREFKELNDLRARRTRFLDWRRVVEDWKADQAKADARTPEQAAGDGVGEKLREFAETRHQQRFKTVPADKRKWKPLTTPARRSETRGVGAAFRNGAGK